MKQIIFTLPGMLAVARVMASCKMVMKTANSPNEKYFLETLAQCAKIQSGLSAEVFLGGIPLPERDKLFRPLFQFAKVSGRATLDEDGVWLFFGGQEHFKRIQGGIQNDLHLKARGEEINRLHLLAHLLLPVRVTDPGSFATAVYRNGPMEMVVKGICLISPSQKSLALGRWILVHFATAVSDQVSDELAEAMLAKQAEIDGLLQLFGQQKELDGQKLGRLIYG